MALSIKNQHAEEIARKVAKESGETITQAIIHALEERLERINGRHTITDLFQEIMNISRRCSSIPEKDPRSPDKILEYNKKTGGLD